MGILENIVEKIDAALVRLERIEDLLQSDRKSAPAPAPQPVYGTTSAPAPAPAPSPVTGPVAVPTLQELTERLLDLNQAQGELPCLDLLRAHGGQDPQGSVNLKFVPETEYAALYQAIGQRLGVH